MRIGAQQGRHFVHRREVWGVKDRSREEGLARRNKVKEDKHLEVCWGSREEIGKKTYLLGIKRRDREENVFARPNGQRENAGTAMTGSGPGPSTEKK